MQTNHVQLSSCVDYYFWKQESSRKAADDYRKKLVIALRIALDEYRLLNPDGYQLIAEYYLGDERITIMTLGKLHGIATSTAGQKLLSNMKKLRKLAFQHLEQVILHDDYEWYLDN